MKSGVYTYRDSPFWILVKPDSSGLYWRARTNDEFVSFSLGLYRLPWAEIRAAAQRDLDRFADENGLDEVPLSDVRKTYQDWSYEGDLLE